MPNKEDNQAPEDKEAGMVPIPKFLESVLQKARAQKDCDEKLLDILETQIVNTDFHINAVASALTKIGQLAEERVSKDKSDE